jgi:hypothetical protein
MQLLPPPLKPIDPAERLGIDLSSLHTAEDLRQLLSKVLAAIAHGEITPAEGARLARRARTRLRAIRRLARFERRLPHSSSPLQTIVRSEDRGSPVLRFGLEPPDAQRWEWWAR